ncbi:MAG: hypothetical protein JSU87_08800, partial [Gemmatimonadota bacterium]
VKQTGASRFPGNGEFRGENRPYGVLMTISLNVQGLPHPDEEVERQREEAERKTVAPEEEEPEEENDREAKEPEVTIEISDSTGAVIRTFEEPATLGVNRIIWDLRRDGFKRPQVGEERSDERPSGPEVLPGAYGVRISYGDHEAGGSVRVLADPRFEIPEGDRQRKYAAVMHAGAIQEVVSEMIERIHHARSEIDEVLERARDGGEESESGSDAEGESVELVRMGRELKKTFGALEERLWVPPDTKGIVGRENALSKIGYAQGALDSSWGAPTSAQETYLRQAENAVEELLAEFNRVFGEDVEQFRARVAAAGIEFLRPKEALRMPER